MQGILCFRFFLNIILYSIWLCLCSCTYEKDWGSVETGKDENGHWYAVLENPEIRCRYSWKPYKNRDKGGETNITELLIKKLNQNQAAADVDSGFGRIDACAGRYNMIEAAIEHDGNDYKSVLLEWKHKTEGKICKQIVDDIYLQT
jgi:hypothetical protein